MQDCLDSLGMDRVPIAEVRQYAARRQRSPGTIVLYCLRLDDGRLDCGIRADSLNGQWRRRAAARDALQRILAADLNLPHTEVPLTRDPNGKPCLGRGEDGTTLQLSCAYTRQFAVLAISSGGQVGVDIEVVNADRFPDEIADVLLSPRERRLYRDLPAQVRPRWMAGAWVRKEAILKGLGRGLQIPPALIEAAEADDGVHGETTADSWRRLPGLPKWSVRELAWAATVIGLAQSGPPSVSLRTVEVTG